MAEFSLREYETTLDELLEGEAYDEVIVWARHLLQTFPKCLTGYRYLAEAALETGQREEAVDLFRRLLSADPEHFVAYVGLASIYSDDNVYDEAIWHMMRAFELVPDNQVVREQLRDLYKAHDGRRPGRLKLNRAALGRVYLRNGEYDLAADEFAAELAEAPNRIDLRVARAEALWRAGRRQSAVEEAENVLEELPNALKARLILGQFYAEEGSADRASEHLQRAQALDPENRVAQQLFGVESTLQRRTVHIEEPRPAAEMPGDGGAEDAWFGADETFMDFDDTDLAWDEMPTEAEPALDWRADLRLATEDALADVVVVPPEPAEVAAPEEPIWIQQLRAKTETALREPPPEPATPTVPEEAPFEDEPAEAPEELQIEWRAALRAATDDALAAWEPPVQPEVEEPAPPVPEAPAPSWRADLRAATADALADAEAARDAALEEAPEPVVEEAPDTVAWDAALREETGTALDEAEPPAEVSDEVDGAEPPVAPTVWWAELREATEAALADVPPAAPVEPQPVPTEPAPSESWRAELRTATDEVLDEAERAHAAPEPSPEPPVAPEPALEPTPEPEEVVTDVAAAREPAAEPAAPADELTQARKLAASGDEAAALERFQAVFEAGDDRDDALADALGDWIATGDVKSAGPHQLLGDVYRRMGRLQEAVDQYRAALQKA